MNILSRATSPGLQVTVAWGHGWRAPKCARIAHWLEPPTYWVTKAIRTKAAIQPTRGTRVLVSPSLISSHHRILEPYGRWHATVYCGYWNENAATLSRENSAELIIYDWGGSGVVKCLFRENIYTAQSAHEENSDLKRTYVFNFLSLVIAFMSSFHLFLKCCSSYFLVHSLPEFWICYKSHS